MGQDLPMVGPLRPLLAHYDRATPIACAGQERCSLGRRWIGFATRQKRIATCPAPSGRLTHKYGFRETNMRYADIYRNWKDDPEAYWLKQAEAIDWDEAPTKALFDRGDHMYEWFADARVNTCYNAVDRHVAAGRGAQVAIIHDSPVTGTKNHITRSLSPASPA